MKQIVALGAATLIGLLVGANSISPIYKRTATYLTSDSADGSRIAWDYRTLRKIAPLAGQKAGYHGYARLIQRADKSLLCVYEASGTVEIVKSTDGGATWSGRVVVAARESDVSMAVPEIVELQDRSLLVAYNPRPGRNTTGKRFGICTIKSYDGGTTWTDKRTVYEAGSSFDNGCWEPVAIQLPSGEVQLYFSDEGVYTTSNEQNISLMRSADGGRTWTDKPEIVSFRPGRRDGMPVPVLLNGNEIAFSIEDNVQGTFKPYIIRNALADNWKSGTVGGDSPSRASALKQPLGTSVYAGAPYLRQLQSGETVLSVQSTEDRSRNDMNVSRMVVYIGSSDARNFNRPSEPFAIKPDKSGLWNSLSVLNNGTVIALTSTNSYVGNASEVWMIKGYVIPEQTAKHQRVRVNGDLTGDGWPAVLPIFVGHRGESQLRAGFAYDADYLVVGAAVQDSTLHTDSPTPLDDDGIWVSLDMATAPTEALTRSSMQFIVSADGRLLVRCGEASNWVTYAGMSDGIRKAVKKGKAGYVAEIAIPWSLLGGKSASKTAIRYTIDLINDIDGGTAEYMDGISGNQDLVPTTWSVLKLK